MEININDVLNFCFCPKYYNFIKNDKNGTVNAKYNTCIKQCFFEYLYQMQNNTLTFGGLGFLKYRWGKLWIRPKRNSELVCTPSAAYRDKWDIKRKHGIEALVTFDELMNTSQLPIIINKPYKYRICKGLYLTGKWEYVREITKDDGTKVIQLIKFRPEHNKFNVHMAFHHDLEITAAYVAFLDTFNVSDVELILVDIYSKKMYTTIRTEADIELLKQTTINVAKSIKNNIECVSPDEKCYHCEYRNECEKSFFRSEFNMMNLKINNGTFKINDDGSTTVSNNIMDDINKNTIKPDNVTDDNYTPQDINIQD